MSFDLAVGVGQRCTLYSRSEYRSRFPVGAPGESAGKTLIGSAVAGDLARDTAQRARLCDFLRDCRVGHYGQSTEPLHLLHAVQRAVSGGDVVAVVEPLRSSGVPSRTADEQPRSRAITFTPSQVFRRAVTNPVMGRHLPSSRWKRLRAQDGIAIWLANPGDILPDGTIARPLGSAQPLEYRPELSAVGDGFQLAGSTGTPGNNQAQNRQFKAVVRIMGLSQHQARLLHEEISGEGLGYHEILERARDMFGGSDGGR